MDLHAKIMGLDVPTYSGLIASPDYAARMGYLDARHAAAALALEQQAELEALRGALTRIYHTANGAHPTEWGLCVAQVEAISKAAIAGRNERLT